MQEYKIIVPLYGKHTESLQKQTDELKEHLLNSFDGYSLGSLVYGCYKRESDGIVGSDVSSQIFVAADNEEKLFSILENFLNSTNMECLYVVKTGDATFMKRSSP